MDFLTINEKTDVIQDFLKTKPELLFFKVSPGLSESRKAVKPVHSVVLLLTLLPSRAFYLSNDISNLRYYLLINK